VFRNQSLPFEDGFEFWNKGKASKLLLVNKNNLHLIKTILNTLLNKQNLNMNNAMITLGAISTPKSTRFPFRTCFRD
jgi:hypothetical protein